MVYAPRSLVLQKFNRINTFFFFFENEDYYSYKNQPSSTKRTLTKYGGTSSTHIDKPLTFLQCLARLWTILLPLLRTWEKLIQVLGPSMDFADSRRWPNEESEASLLRRELITTSESPSSTNSIIPSSCARPTPLLLPWLPRYPMRKTEGLVLTARQSHFLDYHEQPLLVQPYLTPEKSLHRNSV